MKFYSRVEAIRIMNERSASRQPFIFIIDFKQEQILMGDPAEFPEEEIAFDFRGFTNVVRSSSLPELPPYSWRVNPYPQEQYGHSFRYVLDNLLQGNSYLVNLTCAVEVNTDLSLRTIFDYAKAPYRLWMKDRFVVFSPEIFVRIKEDYIYSYPMKGTIDGSLPDARNLLLNDPKEAAEHATITDLIRNDLSMVSNEVEVTRYRYIDEVETNKGLLLQASSEIRGKLPEDWQNRLGEIFFSLLPAGSITGAPKKKTVEIIAAAEQYERGFYTGVMGYFDGNELDSAVMIRFIEQQENTFYYKSGGGITAQSNQQNEYDEVMRKIYVPFR